MLPQRSHAQPDCTPLLAEPAEYGPHSRRRAEPASHPRRPRSRPRPRPRSAM